MAFYSRVTSMAIVILTIIRSYAFKHYKLHKDAQFWQLATTYWKSLDSFSIEIDSFCEHLEECSIKIALKHFIWPKEFEHAFTQI